MNKLSTQELHHDRSRFAKALAASLLLHALLLILHFDIPGLGLPGLDLPWQKQRVRPQSMTVVLAAPSSTIATPDTSAISSLVSAPLPSAQSPAPIPPPNPIATGASTATGSGNPDKVATMSTQPVPAISGRPVPRLPSSFSVALAPALEPQQQPAPTHAKSPPVPQKRIFHKPPQPKIIVQEEPLRETFSVQKSSPDELTDILLPEDAEMTAAEKTELQIDNDTKTSKLAKATDKAASRQARELEKKRQKTLRLAQKAEERKRAKEQETLRLAAELEARKKIKSDARHAAQEIVRQQKLLLEKQQAELLEAELAAKQTREIQRQEALRQAQREAEDRKRVQEQETLQLAAKAEAMKQALAAEARKTAEAIVRQQALMLEKQQAAQLAAELAAQQAREIQRQEALRQAQREAEELKRASEQEARRLAAESEANQKALEAQARKTAEEAGQRLAAEAAARAQAAEIGRQQALALAGSRGVEQSNGSGRNEGGRQSLPGSDKAGGQSVSRLGTSIAASSSGSDNGHGENLGTNSTSGGSGGQANVSLAATGGGATSGGAAGEGGTASGRANEAQGPNRKAGSRPEGQPDASRTVVPANSPRRGTLLGSYEHDIQVVIFAEVWRRNVNSSAPFSLLHKAKTTDYKNPWVTVALRSDGSVESIKFDHTSGVPAIDTAVQQIILMLSPFDPFPPELAAEYDVIDIPSIWTFNTALRLIWSGG